MNNPALQLEVPQLADRETLLATVATSLETANRTGELVAIISVKVNRLKAISIEYGYAESDELIEMFLERLHDCLRDKDTLARIGNDEFAILLPDLKNPAQPLMAISKIQRTCLEPAEIGGKSIQMSLVFGLSIGPDDADRPEALLRCADLALQAAEVNGLESARYVACTKTTAPAPMQLETDLRTAIYDGALQSVYQPIVDVETGEIAGVELLSRWPRPDFGDVSPLEFIGAAERSGLIMPLTLWSLNNGLRECSDWQIKLPSLPVSINFSPLVLVDRHIPEVVLSAIKLWGADVLGLLTVEVTETAIMADPQACTEILNQLHSYGVKIAIDDFGTGYSSLAYLKQLPVDILKIDQSFVTNMINNPADRRIVQTIIDLAHNFDLTVVAEGVEDEETLDTLMLMVCQRAQGFHVARPMPASELACWFEASPWEQIRG
ncbi:MAG: bifunctional diguanylate cyclase/phosphodiesterase [Proteobacteria bacterium]|nr:bifunctional diguanylate cyclase/phosphodiesterase [Pseudomonadota bacterium]